MLEPISPEQGRTVEIASEVNTFITSEADRVEKETAQYLDKESAKVQGQLIEDLRRGEYFALKWLDGQYRPETVLYPGSGGDRIPKYVFGGDKVVHISLEEYAGKEEEIGKRYFEDIREGMNTIADVGFLPLQDSSVDLVVLLESNFIEEPRYIGELTRVLKSNGMILLSKDFMSYEDDKERESKREKLANIFDGLVFEKLPTETDYGGENIDIEYYILRKN